MSEHALATQPDAAAARAAALLERLLPAPRDFALRLWEGTELPATAEPEFTLVLNHPGALRRMLRPPLELSVAEAFIYGDFDIEGDIFSAFRALDVLRSPTLSLPEMASAAVDILSLPSSLSPRLTGRGRAYLSGAVHSRERDRAAIQYHYDVGNDFYALWLDHNMQYSCAYFAAETDDLDRAQERKLEHICRKLRLQPGERLLDIGCGWGGLACYAASRYGVQATGVTLSRNQVTYANAEIARRGLGERVSVKLEDYRDLEEESFDKIVSVGMFEHVGRTHLPEYFDATYHLLKPGGLFLNHGIANRRPLLQGAGAERPSVGRRLVDRWLLGSGRFIQSYVFPDGELVSVSEANMVAEAAGFEVRDVENLREHYALTLRQWVSRLESHRLQAIEASDEATYRTWRLFMAASAYGFESMQINVNQSLLAKPVPGKSGVPLTRADIYLPILDKGGQRR